MRNSTQSSASFFSGLPQLRTSIAHIFIRQARAAAAPVSTPVRGRRRFAQSPGAAPSPPPIAGNEEPLQHAVVVEVEDKDKHDDVTDAAATEPAGVDGQPSDAKKSADSEPEGDGDPELVDP